MEKADNIEKQIEETHLSGSDGIELLKNKTLMPDGLSLKHFLCTEKGKEALKMKKIIIAGPPKSGKSCMRQALKDIIKKIPNAPYPYVLTACPDGEGAWFQETMNANVDLANKLKKEYKSKFTPEFTRRISESVDNLNLPLSFIDIGGVISDENMEICRGANMAILICGETSVTTDIPKDWKDFFNKLGIPVIAEIYSDYYGVEDIEVDLSDDGVFRGSVHHLERGEDLTSRKTLINLSKHIINLDNMHVEQDVEFIKSRVDDLINDWQEKIPEAKLVLGGSLVSGLFIYDEETKLIDVDLRFLLDSDPDLSDPKTKQLISKIEEVTKLKFRRTIKVFDWPDGFSDGIQIEGRIELDGIHLPLDVEGCVRNNKYVGWGKYYKDVLTPQELEEFRAQKIRLRHNKSEYKDLKQRTLLEVKKRCLDRGIVSK